jgi:hypothetical protein
MFDGQGNEGAITFGKIGTVVVLFDHESDRSPFAFAYGEDGTGYDIERFFRGMPAQLRKLAQDEALQFMLQDYQGGKPGITAAMWGEGETITAAEPWDAIREHGGFLIEHALLDPTGAITDLQDNYALSDSQAQLLAALFERRLASEGQTISLTEGERAVLMAQGKADIQASRKLFELIHIILP